MNKATIKTTPQRSSLWKRLGWMVTIWLCSVLALYAVSTLFRALMTMAGMKIK
ncbi:DUF2474 domain-containing protein [Xenorhabdus sp. XENO-10]|uniref:DUF2474 domain-containing protein n=1 Tax=Xenorhabdus yunnanensis TaxID=3025878 RepID=A0ABT5LJR1_9GAMM|nr:DUF2474 domain-containing protein [Xenorhabdus yunnanensis]MDC9591245.1 DUF2474 domain-containing protein [Xenorhabdus yunnanensis]